MSNSRVRLSNRADDDDKPHNSSKGKGIILETPYKPGFIDDADLETVKMAVDKELSDISNAFYQTIERTADTITRVDKIEINTDGVNAKIEEVDKVSKEGDIALASRITTISAQVDDNTSSIVTESEARATADSVMTKRIDTILGSMQGDLGPLVGQFQEQIRVLGETDGILAERITDLTAEYKTADGDIKASVSAEESARVTADKSLASQITTVKSEMEGQIAVVKQYADTEISKVDGKVDKVNAKWGVSVNVNNKVTGIQLNNDGKSSTFSVQADKFTVSDGSNAVIPFEVVGGHTRINSAYINSIQSDSYSSTVGWAINRNGSAVFNNVTVRGTVYANTFIGIGGSTIELTCRTRSTVTEANTWLLAYEGGQTDFFNNIADNVTVTFTGNIQCQASGNVDIATIGNLRNDAAPSSPYGNIAHREVNGQGSSILVPFHFRRTGAELKSSSGTIRVYIKVLARADTGHGGGSVNVDTIINEKRIACNLAVARNT